MNILTLPDPNLDYEKFQIEERWKKYEGRFPFDEPYPIQKVTVALIDFLIERGVKNFILQSPVGTGKTVLAVTIARAFENCYYLTPKNGLAEQVQRDFPEFKQVKGRANFSCILNGDRCDNAQCVLKKDFKCPHKKGEGGVEVCPYFLQKGIGIDSPTTVSNPAYLNRVMKLKNKNSNDVFIPPSAPKNPNDDERFSRRQFAVWDEAHNLEDHFINMEQYHISDRDYEFVQRLRGIGKGHANYKDINMDIKGDDYEYVVQEIVNFYGLWQKSLIEYIRSRNVDPEKVKRLLSIGDRVVGILDNFNVKKIIRGEVKIPKSSIPLEIFRFYPNEFNPYNASVSFEFGSRSKKWIISPVIVNDIARSYIDKTADINMFVSATIIDFVQFAKGIGISTGNDTVGIKIDESPFEEERRPIFYTPAGMMNRNKIEVTLPLMAKKIEDIIKQNHMEHRGIILPYTHKIRNYLVDYLTDVFPGRILTHGSDVEPRSECPYCDHKLGEILPDEKGRIRCPSCGKIFFNNIRSATINRFLEETDKPYILISTYINEGFDLKGDIARFAIICKIPYPYLGDGNVKKRILIEQDMYREATGYTCDYQGEDISKMIGGKEVRYTLDVCNNTYKCGRCRRWYNMKTVAPLIQMTGRVVRDKDDYAAVYIMDQGFKSFVKRHSHLFPSYFVKSIRWFDK